MKLRRPQPEQSIRPRAVDVVGDSRNMYGGRFDIHKDLSPAQLGEITEQFRIIIDSESHNRDLEFQLAVSKMARLILIFPEAQAELSQDEALFVRVKLSLGQQRDKWNEGSGGFYYSRLGDACLLFPDRRDELGADEEVLDRISKRINVLGDSPTGQYAFLKASVTRLIMFPEHSESKLSAELFQDLLEYVHSNRGHDMRIFAETLAFLMLLYPERRDQMRLDEEVFSEMKNDFFSHGMDDTYTITRLSSLTVLSSDEVRVTEKGIELIEKTRLSQAPTLPARNLAQ